MIPLQPVFSMKFMRPLGDKGDVLMAEIPTPEQDAEASYLAMIIGVRVKINLKHEQQQGEPSSAQSFIFTLTPISLPNRGLGTSSIRRHSIFSA